MKGLQYQSLPDTRKDGVEQMCVALQAALGDKLVSVAVYGSPAREAVGPSDPVSLPLLIVMEQADVDQLASITGTLAHAIDKFGVAPFILSRHDLESSTDIFPIKFQDMQLHHILLAGTDIFSGLTISVEHLRLRCEQEIKNLLIRLRNQYIRSQGSAVELRPVIRNAVESFFRTLTSILSLKTELVPAKIPAIAEMAAAELAVDPVTLERLIDSNHLADSEVLPLFTELLETVELIARLVDRMDSDTTSRGL
ncbi:MAG: hypothetical protein MK102_16880 [Fuerstiella sp.]|nr:hypothetical protein [Fuerstiella sp.]